MAQKAYLTLADGSVIEGEGFGAAAEVTAEVVFTTSMTGYIETLTDPSYYGQIVVQTFPLIGNVGIIPADFESVRPMLKGYIVRSWCQAPSNYRAEGDLDTFLRTQNVPAVSGIDTRALTKRIREYGVMNGHLGPAPVRDEAGLRAIREFRIQGALDAVSIPARADYAAPGGVRTVALWDCGAKENIARELLARGCSVIRLPYSATAEEIASLGVDGVMLTNGPGDPADFVSLIEEIRKVYERKIPIFGICLGHQLLALASGAKTAKLKYGHRGANQPVMDTATKRIYITGQNHGYYVLADTLPPNARESFVNLNDGTCEGVDYLDRPAFSVQYHPEAAGGPLDNTYLFDRFIQMMDAASQKARGGQGVCR